MMMIRARNAQHLRNLQDAFPCLAREIKVSVGTDYYARIIVEKTVWVGVMAELVVDQDYANFKSECARSTFDDSAYLSVLHQIWGVAMRLQERAHGVGYGGAPISESKIAGYAGSDLRGDLVHTDWGDTLLEETEARQRSQIVAELKSGGCPADHIESQTNRLMKELRDLAKTNRK